MSGQERTQCFTVLVISAHAKAEDSQCADGVCYGQMVHNISQQLLCSGAAAWEALMCQTR
jgi:hypothetical protein